MSVLVTRGQSRGSNGGNGVLPGPVVVFGEDQITVDGIIYYTTPPAPDPILVTDVTWVTHGPVPNSITILFTIDTIVSPFPGSIPQIEVQNPDTLAWMTATSVGVSAAASGNVLLWTKTGTSTVLPPAAWRIITQPTNLLTTDGALFTVPQSGVIH